MIICQGKLSSFVPLENASMPGRVVAQWDKDDCEDLGIIKVDLLGLGMMSVMQDTLRALRASADGRSIWRTFPTDDRGDLRDDAAAPTRSAFSKSRAARRWRRCRG